MRCNPVLFLAVILIFSGTLYGQLPEDSVDSDFSYGGQVGLGISHLGNRDTVPENAALPVVGIHGQYYTGKYLGIMGSAQYSMRGSNTSNMAYKYRLHYLDLDIMPEFYFLDYFTLRAGVRYAMLLNQQYKVLEGETSSGYTSYNMTKDYGNEIEAILGLEAAFNDEWALFANYTIPVNDLPYSNIQIGIAYKPKSAIFEPAGPSVREIPSDESKWPFITDLKLNNDGLLMIPPEVYNMEKLEKLSVIRNSLTRVPPEIGRLEKLEYLALQFNEIEVISDSIGQLTKLEYLDLRYNELETLPESIAKLENLQFLYLGHNDLRQLPNSIGDLKNLQYLHIGKNYLDEVPESLFELSRLIELDLRDSGLMSIPDKLYKLRNLERLYVDFPVPPSVVSSNPRLEIITSDPVH
ncbi:MAG: outer membrane beta-barrel protein [Bacteroidales bacterium]